MSEVPSISGALTYINSTCPQLKHQFGSHGNQALALLSLGQCLQVSLMSETLDALSQSISLGALGNQALAMLAKRFDTFPPIHELLITCPVLL